MPTFLPDLFVYLSIKKAVKEKASKLDYIFQKYTVSLKSIFQSTHVMQAFYSNETQLYINEPF